MEEARTAAAIKVLQEIFRKENACGACGERGHTSPICTRQEITRMTERKDRHDKTKRNGHGDGRHATERGAEERSNRTTMIIDLQDRETGETEIKT